MFEALPPHDVQAEESLVASLMVDDALMAKVAGVLPAMTLREAEEQLVACCMTDKAALRLCLETLPAPAPFRSSDADDLHGAFYLLAGWLARNTWDSARNETHLAIALAEIEPKNGYHQGIASWTNWLDGLWHIWAPRNFTGEDFCSLLDQLVSAYKMQDAELAAVRARIDGYPFELDEGYEDSLYIRLQEAIMRRRKQGRAPLPPVPEVPPPPVAVDWDEVYRRVQR